MEHPAKRYQRTDQSLGANMHRKGGAMRPAYRANHGAGHDHHALVEPDRRPRTHDHSSVIHYAFLAEDDMADDMRCCRDPGAGRHQRTSLIALRKHVGPPQSLQPGW
jgi:hypothetical protein